MLKYNPNLEINTSEDLNKISSNLVKFIKIDEDYNLKFDSSKINPLGFSMKSNLDPKKVH
jgi:hypothetical protein